MNYKTMLKSAGLVSLIALNLAIKTIPIKLYNDYYSKQQSKCEQVIADHHNLYIELKNLTKVENQEHDFSNLENIAYKEIFEKENHFSKYCRGLNEN